MRTALVATVKDEAKRLPEFLASLEAQTRRPDLVVITDGGSTDGTQEVLAAFTARTALPFRWVLVPGNRSKGRNGAIRLADADVVAVTDVGVVEPTWFERIVAPIERGEADVVGGWYELLVDTPRERAVGLMTQYSIEQIDPKTFLPSARSIAFTRAAWERVGGYPEDLVTTEDTMFDLALRRAGLRFAFEPRAIVRWRPPTTAKASYRMYRQFAETDAQAGIFLWSYTRYGFLYAAYAAGIALLLLGVLWPWLWVVLVLAALAYVAFRIRKVPRAGLWGQIPYAVLVGFALDLAWMAGYARGKLRKRGP